MWTLISHNIPAQLTRPHIGKWMHRHGLHKVLSPKPCFVFGIQGLASINRGAFWLLILQLAGCGRFLHILTRLEDLCTSSKSNGLHFVLAFDIAFLWRQNIFVWCDVLKMYFEAGGAFCGTKMYLHCGALIVMVVFGCVGGVSRSSSFECERQSSGCNSHLLDGQGLTNQYLSLFLTRSLELQCSPTRLNCDSRCSANLTPATFPRVCKVHVSSEDYVAEGMRFGASLWVSSLAPCFWR